MSAPRCAICHDSGSKNQTGDYLDCPACDMPHTRKALNDFVKSLGPTHPEDVALAIHQRALAMVPKQEAPAGKLGEMELNHAFDYVTKPWAYVRNEDISRSRAYFKAGYKYAFESAPHSQMSSIDLVVPAAANGVMPELPDPLEIDWPELHSSALGCGVEDRGLHDRYECAEYGWQDGVDKSAACVPDAIYDADQMRTYGQACHAMGRGAAVREYVENGTFKQPVAAAGPDAALPDGYVMVPLKPTHAMIKAMAESRATDDEGEFPAMLDLLDFSGENKTHTVLEAAYVAALSGAKGN
jgi:hypothetical protein